MKQPIDLSSDHAKIVHEILHRHLPSCGSVKVFGSRAKWTAKSYSDLDLAIKAPSPIPHNIISELEIAFSESDLPFRVDIVDWHALSAAFQLVIDNEGIMLPWPTITIGELILAGELDLQTGPFGAQLHSYDYKPFGVAVVPTEAIKNGRIDHSVLPKITPAKADELSRHRLQEDDILFARRGVQATGQTAIIRASESSFVCGTGAIRLRIRANSSVVHPQFLAQFLSLKSSVEWLKFHAIGATMPNLNEAIISAFPLSLPLIEEQRKIASVLGALDDKIELNRRMNETLEAMARAIFKDWFVDFGPTRAKMEGRPPYLAPDIWSLFPERLDDEGKPEGWESAKLGAVTSELRRGVSPKYTTFGGIIVLNQKCIRNRQVDMTPARFHDDAQRDVSDRMIQTGDILVNSTGVGTLGRVAQLWKLHNPMIVDSHVTVVRPNSEQVSRSYLGVALTEREAEIEALGEGSTGQTELTRARLADLDVLIPNLAVQAAFDSLAVPILDRMEANRAESRTLATTRDFLLPKLMSGEVRIKDAEKLVGEAT